MADLPLYGEVYEIEGKALYALMRRMTERLNARADVKNAVSYPDTLEITGMTSDGEFTIDLALLGKAIESELDQLRTYPALLVSEGTYFRYIANFLMTGDIDELNDDWLEPNEIAAYLADICMRIHFA